MQCMGIFLDLGKVYEFAASTRKGFVLFSNIYCQFTYFHFNSLELWTATAVIINKFAYNV